MMPIARWTPWRIALMSFGWVMAVLGYIAIRSALIPRPPTTGLDTYYIVYHLHHAELVFLGPPLLLITVWLWRREAERRRD